ncbi:hypothetical protein Tco_0064607 [Tanacetum coccineum]
MQLMFIQMNCVLRTRDMILWMLTRKRRLSWSMAMSSEEQDSDEYLLRINRITSFSIAASAICTLDLYGTGSGILERRRSTMTQSTCLTKIRNKVGDADTSIMITDEMKLTEHYKMYVEVFGLDVPLTQSQPTESTQGTHRKPSAPRSPNSAAEKDELSVPKRSTVIHFRLPSRQSARLTPLVPVPSAEKANEMILQDMIQLISLVEDPENVDDSSPPRHDDTSIPSTRFMPRTSSDQLADNLHDVMMETLPSLVKEKVTSKLRRKFLRKFEIKSSDLAYSSLVDASNAVICRSIFFIYTIRPSSSSSVPEQQRLIVPSIRLIHGDDPHDDAYPEGENSAKRQKTSEYEAYVSGESLSGQVNVEEP